MSLRSRVLLVLAATLVLPAASPAAERRPIALDDMARLRAVSDPQISPDGAWVAYAVSVWDTKADSRDSDLWMTSWDGSQTVRLTTSKDSESNPRWSPDGRFLAFLSDRGDENDEDQLWVMRRVGGEAEKVTEFKGGVKDYDWSPDGNRLVAVVGDPDPNTAAQTEGSKKKTAQPIVIDRFQFKEDITGYLTRRRSHLYLVDRESHRAEALTSGTANELLPAWSPDGTAIAFVSKRAPDMDRTDNWDIFSIEPRAGARERQLTAYDGADNAPDYETRPAWSPDSKWIAYHQGGPDKLIYYAVRHLAVVPAAGGPARVLTASLDRNVLEPRFSADGSAILFVIEDDRAQNLARIPVGGGAIEQLVGGRRVISGISVGPGGKVAVLGSAPDQPDEVFAVEGSELRRISHQNDAWLSEVRLAEVKDTSFASKDGTEIHGFLVEPPDASSGRRLPTVLRLHGGPVSQFDYSFELDWQILAAKGYAVLANNPRGSSGRGEKFSLAIWADWGHLDAQDVIASVDEAVRRGIADPDRLAVGGWSYGGMLTNYVIAQDTRFKAATSGASISNMFAGYGTDQYIREYEMELGTPWKNSENFQRVSFPFLHADRIRTPTLFLCGQSDFNVPLLNSEQMYQALRSLGVPTELVIYPGQYHGLTKPSYLRDRLERSIAWYDRYAKDAKAAAAN